MADDVILVTETGTSNLQAYTNTVSGKSVKAEATVQVDLNGVPVGTEATGQRKVSLYADSGANALTSSTAAPAFNVRTLNVRWPSSGASGNLVTLAGGATVTVGSGSIEIGHGNGDSTASVSTAVTAPGAAATIVTTAALAAGKYNVWISTDLGPGFLTADVGNMGAQGSPAANFPTMASLPRGQIGPFRFTAAANDIIQVVAVGAGTTGVKYVASIILVPIP